MLFFFFLQVSSKPGVNKLFHDLSDSASETDLSVAVLQFSSIFALFVDRHNVSFFPSQ